LPIANEHRQGAAFIANPCLVLAKLVTSHRVEALQSYIFRIGVIPLGGIPANFTAKVRVSPGLG